MRVCAASIWPVVRCRGGRGEACHVRSSRPVSSRKTSSRLRRSTASSRARTPWPAHHAVSVASSCGVTSPDDQVAARALFAGLRADRQGVEQRRQPQSGLRAEADLALGAPAGQFGWRARGHEPADVDHCHDVGELLGLVQEMRGKHDADAVGAQLPDQLPGPPPGLRIHPRRRLVQEDQLGTSDQGEGQRQALPLPAGQSLDLRAGNVGQADPIEQLRRVVWMRRIGREQLEQLDRPGRRITADAVLQHHADPRTQLASVPDRVETENPHGSAVRSPESLADLDRRRLAGAVRAEQREHLAAPHGEREPVDRTPPGVRLHQPVDHDGSFGHRPSLRTARAARGHLTRTALASVA